MSKAKPHHLERLPIAPMPMPEESVGGWYGRISTAYGVRFHWRLPVIDVSQNHGKTISKKSISQLTKRLQELTEIESKVWLNRLKSEIKLTNMWLQYQPEARYCFPQLPNYYCIECFFEDMERRGETCYRAIWQSPFVCTCHIHKTPLQNGRFIDFPNAYFSVNLDEFSSLIDYTGQSQIINRQTTTLAGNNITPMARRVSNLFSANDYVSKSALKDLNKYNDINSARSAAIAVTQLLSFRSPHGLSQNVGRTLFAEHKCNEFPEFRRYSEGGLVQLDKRQIKNCFEQVGWFISDPKKFRLYGLQNAFRGFKGQEKLIAAFKKNPLVLLCAELYITQKSDFLLEVQKYHPQFAIEWKNAISIFFEAVKDDNRYYYAKPNYI